MKNIIKSLSVPDIYILLILTIYNLFALILSSKIDNWYLLILENLFISIILIVISLKAYSTNNHTILLLKRISYAPIIYVIYLQIQYYIRPINPYLYDNLLIKIDYFIFGANPTYILHKISNPILTEFLQLSYMLYFLMPLIQGIDYHLQRNEEKFNIFVTTLLCSFFLSYLFYLFMPAIGPRFTLHQFDNLSSELPGLFLTDFFRNIVNVGGGIVNNFQNPADLVNRDCMPSGHTWITLVNIILGFRLNSRFKWLFLFFGISLIFATVYLRYHYVIDVIVGACMALLTLYFQPKLANKIINVLNNFRT